MHSNYSLIIKDEPTPPIKKYLVTVVRKAFIKAETSIKPERNRNTGTETEIQWPHA